MGSSSQFTIMPANRQLLLLALSENSAVLRSSLLRNRVCRRRFGVHPINVLRNCDGEYNKLFHKLKEDPKRFFEYTRMSIETFNFIVTTLEPHLEKKRINLKSQVSAEQRLVVTLRFLATGTSFRHLAFSFRLGRITVSKIVFGTFQLIWKHFVKKFLPQPSQLHLQTATQKYYEMWGFPNCFGAIDGKHCGLKCPPKSGSSHFNYLHYFSIVLMAVADADKKILIVEVGARGKQSDGGTFSASRLYRQLEANEFNVPPDQNLPGTSIKVPNVLIGDEAFPLKPYLMRPYPGSQLTDEKEVFNTRLSRARKTIECAFGILCAKWRFLLKDMEIPSTKKASILVLAACVLHNIVREKDGLQDGDYRSVVHEMEYDEPLHSPQEVTPGEFRNTTTLAKDIREKFTQYFNQNND